MTNPFKELDELEDSIKAPPSIKNKVMGSYGFIVNIAKVVEFIVGSLTNVCTGMLNLLDEKPPSTTPNQNQVMGFSSYVEEREDEDEGSVDEEDKDFN